MPSIDFCFSGWVRGAKVKRATNQEGVKVDVSALSSDELANQLSAGLLSISLGDYLHKDNDESEIEMFDFDKPMD